jgi:hypothetical protein
MGLDTSGLLSARIYRFIEQEQFPCVGATAARARRAPRTK